MKFSMIRDINGYNGFGLPFSDDIYFTTLLTGVEQTLTIPSGMHNVMALFSYSPGSLIYVSKNATANVAGGAFSQTTSELLPAGRQVEEGDVLHFITSDASAIVGVALYELG